MNPRDSIIIGVPRLHRMIRRGTNYGPPLPPEVQEDDGIDRGLLFAFVGAHLDRQFEFIQKEWANDGKFIGAPVEKDPLVSSSGEREFTIPKQPNPPAPKRDCLLSSSIEAANTASCPACEH